MSAHTPGPWRAVAEDWDPDFHHIEQIDGHNNRLDDIAYLTLHKGEVGRANARLIAAAPELLAALVALLDRAEGELADPQDLSEVLGAHAAIAKATGGAA